MRQPLNYSLQNDLEKVSGRESRDWVFVTSTLLEERIAKIKRFSFNQLNIRGTRGLFLRILLTLIVLSGMWVVLLVSVVATSSYHKPSAVLEEARKANQISDPIDAMIVLERAKEGVQAELKSLRLFTIPILILVGLIIVLVATFAFLWRFYPIYNFCWGDYLPLFQRKESVRKFVLLSVLLGVIISCIGSILANMVGKSP